MRRHDVKKGNKIKVGRGKKKNRWKGKGEKRID